MSDKKIETEFRGFSPVIDGVLHDVGAIGALVFGRVWRYCQMKDKVCTASQQRIADDLGLTRQTVNQWMGELCSKGYLKDLTPDRTNRPHVYKDTGRATLTQVTQATVKGIDNTVKETDTHCQEDLHEDTRKIETQEDSTPSGVAVEKPYEKHEREHDEEPLDFTEPSPRQKRTPEQHALGVIQAIANHQKRHDPGGEQPIDPTWANLPVGQAIILTAFYRLAALPPPQAKTRRASAAFAAETLYQETGGAQEAVRRMSEFFHRRREGDESCQFTITTPQSIVNTIAAWQEKTYNPVVSLTLGVN